MAGRRELDERPLSRRFARSRDCGKGRPEISSRFSEDPTMRVVTNAALFLPAIAAGLIFVADRAAGSTDEPELSGYTCCNFHFSEHTGSISDANWSALPMIPAGAPIRTMSYARYSIAVLIDYPFYSRKMRLDLDYGRQQNLADWARKMIVQDDPKRKMSGWPAPVRDAIRAGRIALGMTKEQVVIALGYPPAHETPTLDSAQWKYWYGRFDTFLVSWDESERVKDVIAEPQVRSAVMLLQAVRVDP